MYHMPLFKYNACITYDKGSMNFKKSEERFCLCDRRPSVIWFTVFTFYGCRDTCPVCVVLNVAFRDKISKKINVPLKTVLLCALCRRALQGRSTFPFWLSLSYTFGHHVSGGMLIPFITSKLSLCSTYMNVWGSVHSDPVTNSVGSMASVMAVPMCPHHGYCPYWILYGLCPDLAISLISLLMLM